MKAITTILLAATLLTGCATSETPMSEATPVPQNRIYAAPQVKTVDQAQAIFIRDSGALGSANQLHLFMDGKKIASFETAEFFELVVPAGDHIFGVKPTDPFGLASTFSIDQTMKPGKTYRYRLTQTPNGSRIARID